MLDTFNRLNPIPELKTALLMIWDEMPQALRKSIVSFCALNCINAKGGH